MDRRSAMLSRSGLADHAVDGQLVGVGGNDGVLAGDGVEAELVRSRAAGLRSTS